MNWCLGLDISLDLVDVQVRVVLEVLWQAVVLLDDGVEDGGEVLVRVLISGVDSAVLQKNGNIINMHQNNNKFER